MKLTKAEMKLTKAEMKLTKAEMKLTKAEMVSHIANYFAMPIKEVDKILKAPPCPATPRDEFAKAAMQGLLSATNLSDEDIASAAYRLADAMLEERLRGKGA